uniref:NADH-ubiquinone oxidoreductase chain 4 n=1 Tax=Chelodina novaeguineae TaxID=200900 RepID=A0A455I4X2_9SAUR|nr:NADH dehydrogenase subunit 4 [Chelodina novaeguineae]AUY54968.1 NADH dehydrogenase subunit 4 [Chelodina novaeguineae]
MLKILLPTILLMPTTMMCNKKHLYPTTTIISFMIALLSLQLMKPLSTTTLMLSNSYLGVDHISSPLIILSCWLTPLMILASQNHLSTEQTMRKRMFITTITFLQTSLMIAFSSTELITFYITFEATLIPTLIIITRWGNQVQRLSAGVYFLFYTLIGSMPLLIALLFLQYYMGTLSLPLLQLNMSRTQNSWGYTTWWFAMLTAFMIKMPLYGLHLWLPKAHVEAPIAGSMILAGILLKLGGYGIIRVTLTMNPPMKNLHYPFMMLALWGIIMTSLICLRQTDLKSLIAYSSVSHMGLVIAATLIQTTWAITGATILMIAHGLSSSMLFCLANTNYERTNSRTLIITRNMQLMLPLMTLWWFTASLTNMALPPTINLMGELSIITSMFNWSNITITITGLSIILSATYTLYMFSTTQLGGNLPPNMLTIPPSQTREHLIMTLHTLPMMLLMLKPQLISGIL